MKIFRLPAKRFRIWVQYTVLPAQEMTPATLQKAQALITRSNITVNADLLTNTDVQFVGTATHGR